MDYRLLSDFEAGVLPQRQEFKPNKLFTKRLTKDFAHVRKQLYSYDSVFLIRIIMGHFNDVSQNKISSFVVVDFLGQLA